MMMIIIIIIIFSEVRDHIDPVPLGFVVDKMTQGWELPEYFDISLPVIISTILHIRSSITWRLQEVGGSSNSNKTLNCLTQYTYVFRKILSTNNDHIPTQCSQTVLSDRSIMFSLWSTRVSQMKTLNIFYLVIYWTQKVHNDFIFLCSIVLPPVGHCHCWNL